MKLSTNPVLLALTLLSARATADDCPGDKPWPLTILDGAGLKSFATGTAGRLDQTLDNNTRLCLPDGSVTVSVGANSGKFGALNTLIECNFVSGHQLSFCDISMVQGYSVSLTCEVPGLKWLNTGADNPEGNTTLGYAESLYDHHECGTYDEKNRLCVNGNGPQVTTGAHDLLDSNFFTPAEAGGSETYVSSRNAYPFRSDGPTGVECRVAHLGRSGAEEAVGERSLHGRRHHQHAGGRRKTERAHPRSLML